MTVAGTGKTLIADLKDALAKSEERAAQIVGELVSQYGIGAVDFFQRSARGSSKRERALLNLLLTRGDGGCAVSDQFVSGVIGDREHAQRSSAIQLAAFDPRRVRFAPRLREIAKDRTDPDWAFAVSTLGDLRDRDAVEILMAHTRGQQTPFVLVAALVRLKCPEAALVFEPNLAHPEARTRVFALWGLAALKYEAALGALVHLLDEPDVQTATTFQPGQSRRAAQALAEIHGWPFEWEDRASFEDIRMRARARYSQAFVQACLAALAKGKLTLPSAGPPG
jgi:hypothetical protein